MSRLPRAEVFSNQLDMSCRETDPDQSLNIRLRTANQHRDVRTICGVVAKLALRPYTPCLDSSIRQESEIARSPTAAWRAEEIPDTATGIVELDAAPLLSCP